MNKVYCQCTHFGRVFYIRKEGDEPKCCKCHKLLGTSDIPEEKVYCKGCEWVAQNIVTPGNSCKHKKNKRDTPYEQIQEFIDICNKNNDCKLYEKKD